MTETYIRATSNEIAYGNGPIEQRAINLFRDHFETVAEHHGTEAAWEAVRRLAEICTDPDNITP